MHISDDVLETVRTEGYAIVESFLSTDELAAARQGVFTELPTSEQYFADPDAFADIGTSQFSGIRIGPFPSWELTRIAFHPDLVDAAERFCGSTDLDLYKIELWGKYSGTVDYDQPHHRDFGNHSLVVPRADGRWPQLTTFTLLSDVGEDDGPTKVVPRRFGDDVPMIPRRLAPGDMHEFERSVVGPAGTLFLYTTDVLHRGSAFTAHPRSRFALLADYSARGNPWMGKISWPGRANQPGWPEFMVNASPRQRDLFGFPPPGHEYWNEQTLSDVAARWPGIDLTPYGE